MINIADDLSLSVDHRNDLEHETAFQLYWATCNFLILGILTALVKLPDQVLSVSSSILDLKTYLGLNDLLIIKTEPLFVVIICATFVTGILSLLAYFYLPRPVPKKEVNEQIELHDI